MSAYWIAGLTVIVFAVVVMLWRRAVRNAVADLQARHAQESSRPYGSPEPFETEERADTPVDDTAPAYLSPPEVEPPRRASGTRRR